MAQLDKLAPGVTSVGGSEVVNIHHVSSSPDVASFSVLALDVTTGGTQTTYYYWPNTSGVLRYGSTAPTVATQDTAGSAV